MYVVFRADASVNLGTGHIMRCLTLADELRGKGAEVCFICRDLPGNLFDLIINQGYQVYRLPYQKPLNDDLSNSNTNIDIKTDARETISVLSLLKSKWGNIDWLIIDHYEIEKQWEMEIRPYVKRIMVIDDLANRLHECDVLLDQNYYKNMHLRYEGWVNPDCQRLLGPKYLLIRPEFKEARKKLRFRDGKVQRMLIFFGGTDPTNETAKALAAINLLNKPNLAVDVIVGQANPYKTKVKASCAKLPGVSFFYQVSNMADFISRADLAIGAGGASAWERCYLGLPAITIVVAENQVEVTESLALAGVIRNLGYYHTVSTQDLASAIEQMLADPSALREMSIKAELMVADRIQQGENEVLKAIWGGITVADG